MKLSTTGKLFVVVIVVLAIARYMDGWHVQTTPPAGRDSAQISAKIIPESTSDGSVKESSPDLILSLDAENQRLREQLEECQNAKQK